MSTARRALIAGFGLIGGSIGMALRRRGWHVAFLDSNPDLDPGEAAGERVESLDAAADVVILATPVDVAVTMLASCRAPLITSVCSVMAPLRAAGDDRFVAGHPLAGSANRGIEFAAADLFRDATWFIDRDNDLVREIIDACGAHAELVEAGEHDRAVALTSHLPQILSTALARVFQPPEPALTGTTDHWEEATGEISPEKKFSALSAGERPGVPGRTWKKTQAAVT